MTNGDYIRALIIRKVNSLSYEGLMNYVFDVEDVEGEYPILTMAQDGFEKEVYAAFFTFVFLAIKSLMLIKWR